MIGHILVPLDGSLLAECVLPHAVAIGQALGGRLRPTARITLLRAVESSTPEIESGVIDPLEWHMLKSEADAYLSEVSQRLQKTGLETGKRLVVGEPAEGIIEFAHGEDVDLIILSSHGRSGLSGWNISSVVQKVALRSYATLMIVRAYHPTTDDLTGLSYKRILVPLNGSQRAECVLPLATQLANFHQSRLLLAHVVSKPEMHRHVPLTEEESELRERLIEINRQKGALYLEKLKSRLAVEAETHLLPSEHTTETLHKLVDEENVDMVLLSAHGHSCKAPWPYGNTTLNFIAYGTTPLLIMQDISREKIGMTRAERAARQTRGH